MYIFLINQSINYLIEMYILIVIKSRNNAKYNCTKLFITNGSINQVIISSNCSLKPRIEEFDNIYTTMFCITQFWLSENGLTALVKSHWYVWISPGVKKKSVLHNSVRIICNRKVTEFRPTLISTSTFSN